MNARCLQVVPGLLLSALLVASAPAATQEAPILKRHFRAWVLECYPPREPTGPRLLDPEAQAKRPGCQVEQPVRLKEQDKVAAVVRVRLLGPKRQAFMLFVLPPNAQARYGLNYAVGQDGDREVARIRQCTPDECIAALTLTPELLEALGKARHLLIGFKAGDSAVATLVTLAGFSAALAALQATEPPPAEPAKP